MKHGRVFGGRYWLPALAILSAQALLLFFHLGLLDIWGDELFTQNTVARPLREIIPVLQRDVHPPLYYFLLHVWTRLPLPWSGIAALRAFSAVMALACTVLLDRLWLTRWRPAHRWLALALFAFSPCLLLYGRMARSYTTQTAFAMMAIFLFWRWMSAPREILARALPAWASIVLLLYTHYLPGLASLAAFTVAGWKRLGGRRIAAWSAAAVLAYAPWIPTLTGSLGTWAEGVGFESHYTLTRGPLMEYGFKVAFGLVSLTIGETFTPAALLLVPLLIWLIWRGIRIRAFRPPLVPLIVIASLMGYIGAARWVAWPFVAARLLWLLPFLTLALSIGLTRCHPTARSIVTAAVFLSFAFSALSYFRRENFVNLGYVAPLRELAARIRSEASPHDVVIADGYNADAESIRYYLGFLGNGPAFVALTRTSSAQARVMASAPGVRAVWIVRNTRDVSPERLITNIETDACRGRSSSESLYEPFPSWERGVMQVVTGVPAPLYFYRITVCR